MVVDLLSGPNCEDCGKRPANYKICQSCYPDRIEEVRDIDRYYRSSSEPLNIFKCLLCGKQVDRGGSLGSNPHSFCHKCVPQHPDDTHLVGETCKTSWWVAAIRQGSWHDEDGFLSIRSCPHCGGLLVIRQLPLERREHLNDVSDYWYYQVGSKDKIGTPFYCAKFDVEVIQSQQNTCAHEFIDVYTKTDTASAEEHYREIKGNPAITEYLFDDEALVWDLAQSMAGARYDVQWCFKCGLKHTEKEKG